MKTRSNILKTFSAITPIRYCLLASMVALPSTANAQERTPTETGGELTQEAIVVTGQRGSVRNSIDEKRLADSISDTLSADQADRFPDNNVAEALARIPGVSFQRQNDTGEGQFISIRGLDSAFNTVTANGFRLGTADTFRRTPLDIITGGNISSIKVSKAPLPEEPSEGIGGVVDIRTRGPLERRTERTTFSFDTRLNSFSDNLGYRASFGFNRKWNDKVGINFNINFRERFFDNLQINPSTIVPELLFPQVITGQDGTVGIVSTEAQIENIPTDFIPIDQFTAEQVDFEANDINRENLNISGEIDFRLNETTLFTFGGRFSRTDSTETISIIEFDVDPDDFIVSATGDEFDFDTLDGLSAAEAETALTGVIRSFDDPEVQFEGQIEDEIESQLSLFARGETILDKWQFNYAFGYSRGFEDLPILSIDFQNDFDGVPGGADDLAVTLAPFDLSGEEFVAPNPQDLDVFQLGIDPFCVDEDGDSCGEIVDFDEELEDSLENERFSVKLDSVYEFDSSILQNVKFGFQWERSEFTDLEIDLAITDDEIDGLGNFLGVDAIDGLGDNNATVLDFGFPVLQGDVSTFNRIGSPFSDIGFDGIPLFSGSELRNLREFFRDSRALSDAPFNDVNLLEAEENFFSGYIQGEFNFGRLEIIGGVRLEYYDADFSAPVDFGATVDFALPVLNPDGTPMVDDDGNPVFDIDDIELGIDAGEQNLTSNDNFEVLPRIAVNYDVTDRLKVRGAFTTSIARPDFTLLAAETEGNLTIDLNEGIDPAAATIADVAQVAATLSVGNPELRNAYSYNLDLSFEYYHNEDNAISLGLFYKSIDDFIFSTFATDLDFSSDVASDPVAAFANAPLSAEGEVLIEQLGGIEALFGLPSAADVQINIPVNGNRADVFGVEIGVFHTFSYLPGVLSNLGFIGNLTLQDTSIDINLGALDADDILVQIGDAEEGDELIQSFQFFNSPNIIGNAALFYQDDTWEATLGYRFSSEQLEEIEAFGISQFQQGRGFLDLDIEYQLPFEPLGSRSTIFFQANDLTDNGRRFSVFETRGRGSEFSDLATFNGRTFRLGARVSF